MSSESPADVPSENPPDSINELVVAGEFGFKRIPGPLTVNKTGTMWWIEVPRDAHVTVRTLPGDEGEAAVLIADCEAVGGGIVDEVLEHDDHVEVVVDQYARGDPDGQ